MTVLISALLCTRSPLNVNKDREFLYKFQRKQCFISNQRQHSAQATKFETGVVCLRYFTAPFFLGFLDIAFYFLLFWPVRKTIFKNDENSNQSANDDAENGPNMC